MANIRTYTQTYMPLGKCPQKGQALRKKLEGKKVPLQDFLQRENGNENILTSFIYIYIYKEFT